MAYTNIDDPSAHFQATEYTGTGAAQSVGNTGNSDLKPDWVWIGGRGTDNNSIFDSSRGATKELISNGNNAEATDAQLLTQFDTDGFTVGTNGGVNGSGDAYVGWQWKANGGTTSTNTDGDINSTVQVNSDAGFSIITDSPANNTARTIGHGLGAKPDFIIRRARNRVEDWVVYHNAFESTLPGGWQGLNTDAAYNDSATTLFTSVSNTTFGVGTDFSVNGGYNYITYAFKNVQGYSKFGKYIGNGSTDGPFNYTGFKPAFIMLKQSSNSGNGWFAFDSKRDSDNRSTNKYLRVDESGAEGTTGKILDMYSNGFKIIHADSATNGSGHTYIYMAFADTPFVTATGIPTTAR